MREEFFDIGGQTYRIKRKGEGRPLIALHGFAQSAETWDELEIQGFEIIACDLLGHGKSSKPQTLAPYRLSEILSVLQTLMSKLTQGRDYVLMGYSLGGRLALQYALNYPEEPLSALIVESASPGISNPQERAERQRSDLELAQKIISNGAEWFADFWGRLPLFTSQQKLPEAVQARIRKARAANSPHALALTLEGTGQGQLEYIGDRLSEISSPLLYIGGEYDLKYQQIAKRYFQPLKNSQLAIVPQAGHNAHVERLEEFRMILVNFLAV